MANASAWADELLVELEWIIGLQKRDIIFTTFQDSRRWSAPVYNNERDVSASTKRRSSSYWPFSDKDQKKNKFFKRLSENIMYKFHM
jgi:hypothetical protein